MAHELPLDYRKSVIRVSLVELHDRFEQELQRRATREDLSSEAAGIRARWASGLHFTKGGLLVAVPLLGAAFLIDAATGATLRSWALKEPLTDTKHDSLLAFRAEDLVVLEHGAMASHAGDRINFLHLFHGDAEEPHATLEPHGPSGEMAWAVNPNGSKVVTVAFDDESERLVAEFFDAAGKRLRRTKIGAADETDCGSVCLDPEDHLAVDAEFGLQLRKLGVAKKIAKWASPGPLTKLIYPTSLATAVGIEQGRQGVVWKFRTTEKPKVIGIQLAAEEPVRYLGMSSDESVSWWLATAADGARDLFRLDHCSAKTERAHIKPNDAWSFDAQCANAAFIDESTLVIEPIHPNWKPVSP